MSQKQNQYQNPKIKAKKIYGTDYVIDYKNEPLGRGSFGEVRIAYNNKDENNPKKLACKIISIKTNFKSARNELDMIEQLPYNPYLVNYEKLKFNTHDDQYIFMEYCDGGTLAGQLKSLDDDEYLSEEEICEFIYQFILGYSELYQLNIQHCDLKLENILIHQKQYKIADFGLSFLLQYDNQVIESRGIHLFIDSFIIIIMIAIFMILKKKEISQQYTQNQINYDLGTPLTVAPELFRKQFRDPRYKDNKDFTKADMFSLGCMIYNMIYKKVCHPYVGDIFSKINNDDNKNKNIDIKKWICEEVNKQEEIQIMQTTTCSEELLNLVKRLCDKDISKRMSFIDLLQEDLPYKYLNKNIQEDLSIAQETKIRPVSIFSVNRASEIEILIPQPHISFLQSNIYTSSNNNNSLKTSTSAKNANYFSLSTIFNSQIKQSKKIDISDDEQNIESINQCQALYDELQLEQQLEIMEQEINRLDEKNKIIYVIFDYILYLREIIFFFDKTELHIEALIKIIQRKIVEKGENNKELQNIINNLNKVRGMCVYQALNRNEQMEKYLEIKFKPDQILQFQLSSEYTKILKLLELDRVQLKENINSIPGIKEANIKQQIIINCVNQLDQVFSIFDDQKILKQILITYWYIFQIYCIPKETAFFANIRFEQNIKSFTRYYENIDHRMTYDQLFKMIVDAMQFIQPGFAFND